MGLFKKISEWWDSGSKQRYNQTVEDDAIRLFNIKREEDGTDVIIFGDDVISMPGDSEALTDRLEYLRQKYREKHFLK
jgi:hypothetical protein